MHRTFAPVLLSVIALGALPAIAVGAQAAGVARVNAVRLAERVQALAKFGRDEDGSTSRVAYTTADREGREYLMGLMKAANLSVTIDAAGNIVGRRKGRVPHARPLVMGSHADTVPHGGNYDGVVGVLGAIEVAQVLSENNIRTAHPLEVVIFQNEEGGLVGSLARTGGLEASALDRVSQAGVSIREGIRSIGGQPERIDLAIQQPGSVAGYLELHVEQGAVLADKKVDIGVVEGIVALSWWDVTIEGKANHAGTTPMDRRSDALVTAAQLVVAVNEEARATAGAQVATVGRMQVFPGAPNVIPGRVEASLEIRDLSAAKVAEIFVAIERRSAELARRSGTTITYRKSAIGHHGALTDTGFRRAIADAARELGLSYQSMPSGAGHDAQSMASIGPIGMIFVPSAQGISHAREEFSAPQDMANGADVLLRTLLELDRSLATGRR